MGAKSVTKKLIRDLTTGEWIDETDLYKLIPMDEPDEPCEAYTRPVAAPPGGAREIRNKQDDTLKYLFEVPGKVTPVHEQRIDKRPAILFSVPIFAAVVLAYWPVIARHIPALFQR